MTAVTGTGPWPGPDVLAAQRAVLDEVTAVPSGVTGIPWAVRLPSRGPLGSLAGATAGLLVDLPVELGAHGWQLADRPGLDLGRLRAVAREDLDALAVAALGYAGPFVVPVCGPLTLAAHLYLARGDRVVGDTGAVAELSESLAAGIAEHLAAVRRAVPGVQPTVLLHEPLLAQVVAGVLPTFSGYSRLRSVRVPVAAELLGVVVGVLRAAHVETVVHVGGAAGLLGPVRSTGAAGLGLTVAGLDERAWERVAEVVEDGAVLWAQLPPATVSSCAGPDVRAQAGAVLDPWRRVGLPARGLSGVTLLAPGGDAEDGTTGAGDRVGAETDDRAARSALASAAQAALLLAEQGEG